VLSASCLVPTGQGGFLFAQNADCLQIETANFLRFAVCFNYFEKWTEIFAKPLDRSSSA
jgi:hypothetical protein